jgi:hypothetical protein
MRRFVLFAAIACVLGGCHSIQELSARRIGCPTQDVAISEKTTGMQNTTWVATCHGRQYECTGVWSGDEPVNVECTPAS